MASGALLGGVYFNESGWTLNVEDARGAVPPFGRTHSVFAREGELALFPVWAPHVVLKKGAGMRRGRFVEFLVYNVGAPD